MHKMLYLLQGTANFLFSAVLSFIITQPAYHRSASHPVETQLFQTNLNVHYIKSTLSGQPQVITSPCWKYMDQIPL